MGHLRRNDANELNGVLGHRVNGRLEIRVAKTSQNKFIELRYISNFSAFRDVMVNGTYCSQTAARKALNKDNGK